MFRSVFVALCIFAIYSSTSFAQENRFVVKITDGVASISMINNDDPKPNSEPSPDLMILCESANMTSSSDDQVMIDCRQATFTTTSGIVGKAMRITCKLPENEILFENDGREPVTLQIAGESGVSFALMGMSIAYNLETHQVIANANASSSINVLGNRSSSPSLSSPNSSGLTPSRLSPSRSSGSLSNPSSNTRSIPSQSTPSRSGSRVPSSSTPQQLDQTSSENDKIFSFHIGLTR